MHAMVETYGEPKKGYLNFTLGNLWATLATLDYCDKIFKICSSGTYTQIYPFVV